MSQIRTKKSVLYAVIAWIILISIAAMSYRFFVAPAIKPKTLADCGLDFSQVSPQMSNLDVKAIQNLILVEDMPTQPITFGRGKSNISIQSQRYLDELSNLINSSGYYILVVGNARSDGDVEIAKTLVESRINATIDYLIQKGVRKDRIISTPQQPGGNSVESQIVSFIIAKSEK